MPTRLGKEFERRILKALATRQKRDKRLLRYLAKAKREQQKADRELIGFLCEKYAKGETECQTVEEIRHSLEETEKTP